MTDWFELREVVHSAGLDEAAKALTAPDAAVLAGGSYLLAERPRHIRTLFDLGTLLESSVTIGENTLELGAALTLQDLIEVLNNEAPSLATAARSSCASRNIRNRRTVGGEIARRRADSDLVVAFEALNPRLEILNPGISTVHLADWDGGGIITRIIVDRQHAAHLRTERFALLPSAAPFVVVAAVLDGGARRIAVGGAGERVGTAETAALDVATRKRIAHELSRGFRDDHTGSRVYKETLVQVALERLEEGA